MLKSSAQGKAQETASEPSKETLEEFKASFAYGSRNDLLFKFLKRLSDAEAGEFLRGLLEKVGESIDDGKMERILAHTYEWNLRAYPAEAGLHGNWAYEDGPFTPMAKPLAESRLALITTTGNFVAGDDPQPFGVEGMTQAEAIPRIQEFVKSAPILSRIPVDTPHADLRVRHPGYDIRPVQADPNTAFPIDRLREFADEGVIGTLHEDAYSFVGATAQTPLIKKHAPEWAAMLKAAAVDAVLLVPV